MVDKVVLTKAGKEELERELRELIDNTREEVKKQLAEARAQGDLSENADYDAARNRQAEVEGRINELENILSSAEIVDDDSKPAKKTNRVALGSTVSIRFVETGTLATVCSSPEHCSRTLLPSLAMTSPPSPTIQPKSAPLTIPLLVCLAIRCTWVTTSIVPATNATSWSQ